MKKPYYTMFWFFLCLTVGILTFVKIIPAPYRVTLVNEAGNADVIKAVSIEGQIINEQQGVYYVFRIEDGKTTALNNNMQWDIQRNPMSAQTTMLLFPLWNRPDLRGANGVPLPAGREFWIKVDAGTKGPTYFYYLIDKEKRTYQRKEIETIDTSVYAGYTLQIAVNGNQVDLLLNLDALAYEKKELWIDSVTGSWYRIDLEQQTVKYIKDIEIPSSNPRYHYGELRSKAERRFVFIRNDANGRAMVKIIDPLTEQESEVPLPFKLDEYTYANVDIASDIIYISYWDADEDRHVIVRYDEAKQKFIEVARSKLQADIHDGYVYQIDLAEYDTPRIEVIDLATGDIVYRGYISVDGAEGAMVNIVDIY
ncbi:hypothetical protein NHG31_04295 [Aerococcaceae bacterium NML171108]|nr:hypothetical protein [Aerococcaceae bacterium NML171108]